MRFQQNKQFEINSLAFLRYADCVSIGDEVLAIQENKELTPAKVKNISSFNMQGILNP